MTRTSRSEQTDSDMTHNDQTQDLEARLRLVSAPVAYPMRQLLAKSTG